jgi:hypothetical protein
MSIYRAPPPRHARFMRREPGEVAIFLVALLFALLPFIGYVVTGSADQLDLGIATLLVILIFATCFRGTPAGR